MKNLELMGLQEMDAREMKNAEGGLIAAIVAICIAAWGIGNLIHDCAINHKELDVTSW